MIRHFSATVYVGTIPGSRLPRPFEDDVLRSRSPVISLNANVKQLYDRDPRQFERRYGWTPGALDTRTYPWVLYKGIRFTRDVEYLPGLRTCRHIDRRRARVLATALDGGRRRLPWAVRAGGLTYIGEIPLNFFRETDRALIFADLLFPALAPNARHRHRAIIRLEDINPLSDPEQLRAVADYLRSVISHSGSV